MQGTSQPAGPAAFMSAPAWGVPGLWQVLAGRRGVCKGQCHSQGPHRAPSTALPCFVLYHLSAQPAPPPCPHICQLHPCTSNTSCPSPRLSILPPNSPTAEGRDPPSPKLIHSMPGLPAATAGPGHLGQQPGGAGGALGCAPRCPHAAGSPKPCALRGGRCRGLPQRRRAPSPAAGAAPCALVRGGWVLPWSILAPFSAEPHCQGNRQCEIGLISN